MTPSENTKPAADCLDAEAIRKAAPEITAPVFVFEEIGSTNTYAKTLAEEGCPEGTLVLANHQTAGRGRRGHSFYSPKDTGLYFSMVIHPRQEKLMSRITPAAAVAAMEAIEETAGIHCGIKWVNDLYIGTKKTAGILAEAVMDRITGKTAAVVIGIGINCRETVFPEELQDIAGSLRADRLSRNALASSLRRHLLHRTQHLDQPELMDLYRRNSIVLGREITFVQNGTEYSGRAEEINDSGNILIRMPDGSLKLLQSGEISIRSW